MVFTLVTKFSLLEILSFKKINFFYKFFHTNHLTYTTLKKNTPLTPKVNPNMEIKN